MMRFALSICVLSVILLGCADITSEADRSIYTEIAQKDRARFAANADKLALVGRTECADGYALELHAPPKISYETAVRPKSRTSENALFWTVRVPDDPPHETYMLTVPVAYDKPEWHYQTMIDGEWLAVLFPPHLAPIHLSLADTPITFNQSEIQGDNILPADLSGPLTRVFQNPESGKYRVHFAPFKAVFGGNVCEFQSRFWEVEFI